MNEYDLFYLILPDLRSSFSLSAERRSPQPQSSQVLCARRKREGGGVDGGRGGVPETQVAEDHRVRAAPLTFSHAKVLIFLEGFHTLPQTLM